MSTGSCGRSPVIQRVPRPCGAKMISTVPPYTPRSCTRKMENVRRSSMDVSSPPTASATVASDRTFPQPGTCGGSGAGSLPLAGRTFSQTKAAISADTASRFADEPELQSRQAVDPMRAASSDSKDRA